jgi:hypothetical protein
MTWRTFSFVVWGVLLAAFIGYQIAGRLGGSRWPRVATMCERVERPLAGRVIVMLGWMWLGWHAFAR